MPERVAMIVNPAATRSAAGIRDAAVGALTPLGLFDVEETEGSGHAADLARAAVRAGATLVLVVGGDGTVNEVAGALAGTDAALAPIPAGSTNVFARALGWPHPGGRMLPALVDALAAPAWREVTLGRVVTPTTDRLFCINAGIGLDAEAVHRVEARPWLKTRLRHAGFAAATVAAASGEARRPAHIALRVDGAAVGEFATVVAACGRPYAYLGPRALDLAPGADFGPRLRWMGLRTARLTSVAATVGGALLGGRHLGLRAVGAGWISGQAVLESDRPVAVQTDGEPLGWHRRIVLSPGPTLRVLVPPAR